MSRFLFFFALALLVAFSQASSVTVLTPDNFYSVVDGSKAVFVEFYAPWCGHCKRLEPDYEKLGEEYQGSAVVTIAKVDCDAHKDLASTFGVSGFPTLKLFPKGWKKGDTPVAYSGGRTPEDMGNFIKEQTGAKGKKKPTAPSSVVDLNDKNFDTVVMDASKNVLVEFYAPWCGHCKHLAPDYEKVGHVFQNEKEVVIAKLDADHHKDLASKYGVSGFPTLKWFAKDKKEPENYEGDRSVEAFVKFINEKAGTSRTADGKLAGNAGRVAALDELAAKFSTGSKQDLLAQAKKVAATLSGEQAKHANYYVKAMEKIISEGSGYASKEVERLSGLVANPSTTPAKADEFTIRANILKAF